MRLFRKRIFRLGNRGLSMVELICAIAIVSVLGTTVSSIMVVSANTYRRGAAETEVQQEAQLVANQVSDLIIDTTKSVAVSGNEVTITQDYVTQGDGSQTYSRIVINLDGTTLYYKELIYGYDPFSGASSLLETNGPEVLAENVTSFTPNASNFATNGSLRLGITISKGDHSFENIFSITARNAVREAVVENASAKVVLKVKKWLLEPCQSLELTGDFAVATDGSEVLWTLDSLPAGETYDADTKLEKVGSVYKLTIGKGETRQYVRCVATVDSKKAYLTVFIRRVTGIDANYAAVSGSNSGNYAANDQFKISATYTGSSLNQVAGASYDTDYVDTRATKYEFESDGNAGNVGGTKAVLNGNTLKITSDFEAGEYVLVKVTSKHAALGVNKTGQNYDPSVYKVLKIGKTLVPPVTITDNGWLRLSDDEQASVGDAKAFGKIVLDMRPDVVDNFIAMNPGMTQDNIDFWHEYTVRYKKHTDSTWIEFPNPSGNGADGMNSGSINIRPLINGSMDPTYDYDVEITWNVYAIGANNFKELLYSYSFGNTVAKVGTGFTSPFFGDTAVHYSWPEAQAIDATGFTGSLFTYDKDSVTGVPKDKDIQNWLVFEVQRKEGGSWTTVSDVSTKTTQGAFQIEQKITKQGLYRVRVQVDFPNSVVGADGKVSLAGGSTRYNLYGGGASGNEYGVFYFKVEPKFMYYSSKLSIANTASVQGIPSSAKKTISSLQRDQEVTILTLDQSKSTTGVVDFNNLRYEVYKWDNGTSKWVADSDISVNGSQEVKIRTSKENLNGLYSLRLKDSNGNAMYDMSTGKGVFCFWIGTPGESPSGADSKNPSESVEASSSEASSESSEASSESSEASSESSEPSSSESVTPSESEEEVKPAKDVSYSLSVTNAYNSTKQYGITFTNNTSSKIDTAVVVLTVTKGEVVSVEGNVTGTISADKKSITISFNNYGNGINAKSSTGSIYMSITGTDGSFDVK